MIAQEQIAQARELADRWLADTTPDSPLRGVAVLLDAFIVEVEMLRNDRDRARAWSRRWKTWATRMHRMFTLREKPTPQQLEESEGASPDDAERAAYLRGHRAGFAASVIDFAEECERLEYDPRMSILRSDAEAFTP